MKKPFKLHNFEGPLDLLLQLIEGQELEITNIAIAEVAEQFMHYLGTVEERHPEELADFLVIATKLLLLKSQSLLPYLEATEEVDPQELAVQLKMYKRYADAANILAGALADRSFAFARRRSRQPQNVVFIPPPGLTTSTLRVMFQDVLQSLEAIVRLPQAAMEKVMSMREKFCHIQEVLSRGMRAHFYELLASADDRHEVVLTFLALLELVKQQAICVKQKTPFGDIEIEKLSL